jgi:hypothetical protein
VLLDRNLDGGNQLHNVNLKLKEPIKVLLKDKSLNISVMAVNIGLLKRTLMSTIYIQQVVSIVVMIFQDL